MQTHGLIDQSALGRKNDYLYRLSVKALILNEDNQVLVVKETGRDWWDLPGGGMDHGESIKDALARELAEEVNYSGNFDYRVVAVDEPSLLVNANVWQVRMIFNVIPENMNVSAGVDGDEIAFKELSYFEQTNQEAERRIQRYVTNMR